MEGFEEIFPDKKGYGEYGVNILKDGVITINRKLREKIGNSRIQFFINESSEQIKIKLCGEGKGFKLNKAGRFCNSYVWNKVSRKKMIVPVHFTISEEDDCFVGRLSPAYTRALNNK